MVIDGDSGLVGSRSSFRFGSESPPAATVASLSHKGHRGACYGQV